MSFGDFLRKWWGRLDDNAPIPLEEDRIPVSPQGRPDASHYTKPLAHYREMYEAFLASGTRALTPRESNLAWRQRIHGVYGLLARGPESFPYALELLRHRNPDAREDGATILGEIGAAPGAAKPLLQALGAESDDVARTAIIDTLGKSGSRAARKALKAIRSKPELDPDTLEAIDRAIERLGQASS